MNAAPIKFVKPKKEIPSLNFYLAGLPHISGASPDQKSPKEVPEASPQNMGSMPDTIGEDVTGEYVGDSFYVGASSVPMTLSPTMAKAKATILHENTKNKKGNSVKSTKINELSHSAKHTEKMQELLAILNPAAAKKNKEPTTISSAEYDPVAVQPKKPTKQPYVSPPELRVFNFYHFIFGNLNFNFVHLIQEQKQKELVEILARQNLTEQQYSDRLKKKVEQEEKRYLHSIMTCGCASLF